MKNMNRREFLKGTGALVAASALPVSLVKVAFGAGSAKEDFTFAHISDSHISYLGKKNSCETGIVVLFGQLPRLTS